MDSYTDSSIPCFTNHGCHGTANVGYDLAITEGTADAYNRPDLIVEHFARTPQFRYNPAADREPHFYGLGNPIRAIAQGEEILLNYLALCTLSEESWSNDVQDLSAMCSGAEAGDIVKYARSKKEARTTTSI
jgi:hypothetical protein